MSLRNSALVRRSIPAHTGGMNTGSVMIESPTVIVLTDPGLNAGARGTDQALSHYSVLDTALRRVLSSRMPRVLVTTPDLAHAASALLPGQDIIALSPPSPSQTHSDWLACCVATAVLQRPSTTGWLLLPSDMPMLEVRTLHAVADGLREAPIAYPCHRHLRGHPVGLSSELHADLIRVRGDHDLRRITARYPSIDIDVDDAGVLMTLDAHSGLNQFRAQMSGPYAQGPQSRPF